MIRDEIKKRAEGNAAYLYVTLKDLMGSIVEHFEDEKNIPDPIFDNYLHAQQAIEAVVGHEDNDDVNPAPWGYCETCELPNADPWGMW